jgi:UDP-glucose:(heptosyl)LPS alpha-1,3-glucosyltransferase
LRLAVVSPFVDRRHGTERALAELLERLAREAHCEIHLYAQRVEDLPFDRSASAGGTSAIVWHKVLAFPGPHLLQFLSWLLLNSFCRRWDRWIHGLRCDLVLSPGINCLDADVVIVHALFHRLRELARAEERASAPSGFFRRLHRRYYYALLSAFERHIYSDPEVSLAAVSPRTAALLHEYFRRQDVRVIPNGVDTVQFSPAARLARRGPARTLRQFHENDFVLLLIGNDWGNKGLPSILEAVPKLLDLPAKLLIVGSDAPAPSREMAARLGVLDRCSWEPARADILDAYAAADVYVSPSREDSFGMPVAEAMACGLPVITSAFAGVSALLHDGVDSFVLRDPHDVESLARLLRMLCEQIDLRIRLGQAAAKTALDWDWDRNAAAIWEFLKEVNARKNSP